jgi:HD-GYP domain
VDCFDALASDRQYRKALPLPEAMAKVVADAGRSFDPRVVAILQRRYIELEKLANDQTVEPLAKLSTDIKVERGSAPDAGFAASPVEPQRSAAGDRSAVIAAAHAAHEIVEVARRSGNWLHVEDIPALLSVRLKRLLPHEALAFYYLQDDVLFPGFVSGENARLFSSLRIPVGEGLSGWVAQNHKAILNGNPSVEPGYLNDSTKYSTLRSALAVPIEGSSRMVAVLALYRAGQDAFTPEDLGIVEALASKIGHAIEQATKPKATATSAGAD